MARVRARGCSIGKASIIDWQLRSAHYISPVIFLTFYAIECPSVPSSIRTNVPLFFKHIHYNYDHTCRPVDKCWFRLVFYARQLRFGKYSSCATSDHSTKTASGAMKITLVDLRSKQQQSKFAMHKALPFRFRRRLEDVGARRSRSVDITSSSCCCGHLDFGLGWSESEVGFAVVGGAGWGWVGVQHRGGTYNCLWVYEILSHLDGCALWNQVADKSQMGSDVPQERDYLQVGTRPEPLLDFGKCSCLEVWVLRGPSSGTPMFSSRLTRDKTMHRTRMHSRQHVHCFCSRDRP